jgi:hypothetical protein
MGERDLSDFAKELEILWIGTRPSTFNIIDAEFIQFLSNPNFVF